MKKLTINSKETLSQAIGYLRDMWRDKKFLTITIKTGKKRTISQNSLSHAWYLQVAREEAEYTAEEIKCLCKFHFGLPILRGDDEEYAQYCENVIDPLPYENKILAMKYFPCTSLMETKQLAEYLESIQKHYTNRVELLFPDEE